MMSRAQKMITGQFYTTVNLHTSDYGVESHITQDQEIQECAFCQQSDVDTTLGLQQAHP